MVENWTWHRALPSRKFATGSLHRKLFLLHLFAVLRLGAFGVAGFDLDHFAPNVVEGRVINQSFSDMFILKYDKGTPLACA